MCDWLGGVFADREGLRNGAAGGPIKADAEYMLDVEGGEICVAFGLMNEGG